MTTTIKLTHKGASIIKTQGEGTLGVLRYKMWQVDFRDKTVVNLSDESDDEFLVIFKQRKLKAFGRRRGNGELLPGIPADSLLIVLLQDDEDTFSAMLFRSSESQYRHVALDVNIQDDSEIEEFMQNALEGLVMLLANPAEKAAVMQIITDSHDKWMLDVR